MKAELILKDQDITGEGAMWHAERALLYWVDIEGCRVHEFNPQTKTHLFYQFDQMVSTIVPDTSGNLILTLQD